MPDASTMNAVLVVPSPQSTTAEWESRMSPSVKSPPRNTVSPSDTAPEGELFVRAVITGATFVGGGGRTVMLKEAVEELPAASVALAVIVWTPTENTAPLETGLVPSV